MSASFPETFEGWRQRARELLSQEVPPAEAVFASASDPQESFASLLGAPRKETPVTAIPPGKHYAVPAGFLEQARLVSAHRDADRWSLLYRVLWRITHGEPELLAIAIDADVARFEAMHRSVRRDMHKMTAFVRFREVKTQDASGESESWFVAWHEPDHHITRLIAKFFTARFNGMRFSILTPDESLHWDGHRAVFVPGCTRADAPRPDEMESLWKTYYASIFNPARIKERAMKKEMAVRYWKNLPETSLIPELIRQAPARLQTFYENQVPGVESFLPPPEARTIDSLRVAAASCRACAICEKATQTVFGEGPVDASIVIVGEQPGDQEDLAGHPFVGPAGKLLDQAFALAGILRPEIYVTNAVKHFKWVPTADGKKRLHQRPAASEIAACKPWLNAELALLRPKILVCLGVSAAQSVLGKAVTLKDVRGRALETPACARTYVTTHPSAILRTMNPDEQAREFAAFVEDLRRATSNIPGRASASVAPAAQQAEDSHLSGNPARD